MIVSAIILIVLTGWIIYSQLAFKYRTNDKKAKQEFAEAGVELIIATKILNGFPVHYVITGDENKPTLFFVHGSPGSWIKFRNYLWDKDFLGKFRMISVDRPGFGYSGFGQAKNLSDQSALISSLLKSLDNGQPVFAMGPSLGGPLVIKLAIDNPGKFSGLVLLAAAIDPAAEKPERWRGILSLPLIEWLVPGAWRPSNKEIWFLKKDLLELAKGFSTITCPVYVFHGDKDQWVDVSNADYAKRMLVNAESVAATIIPGANHSVVDNHFGLIKDTLLNLS